MQWELLSLLSVLLAKTILAVPLQDIVVAEEKIDYRLDGSIKPSKYTILLTPYIQENEYPNKKQFTFDGKVDITIKPQKDNLKHIVLHAKDLTIDQASTALKEQVSGSAIAIEKHDLDKNNDKLTVSLKTSLDKTKEYVLSFVYTGVMKDDMKGFYRSFYIDANGNKRWLGSTQFQTHHARRAFPCFDEPKYKAVFEIQINRHNSMRSWSNMQLKESTNPDTFNRVVDTFEATPIMSSYIVAFIVSDFRSVLEDNNKDFTVIARPNGIEQAKYSFDVGKLLLKKLDNYFKLPYHTFGNKKMDLAAIPDFSAGAMENWGLLTFRERALLYDPKNSNVNYQQSIAAVIAHEQAHMWFGDLVTCDWWSYAWLNEGFARYFQSFITHEVNPEWEMDKQFVVDQIHSVFTIDASPGAHPLSDETAESPSDLAKMFDTVTYNKGASVIRMISHMLGEDKFKAALQSYLSENKHQTSVPEKLLKHFKAQWNNKDGDFNQIFKDFTEQVGYPVINVVVNEDKKSLTLTQKRFVLKSISDAEDKLTYTVPITFTTNTKLNFENTQPTHYLSKTGELKIPLTEAVEYVIVNIQQTGYYRVNYDKTTWQNIHKQLNSDNFEQIHELNRAQIVDDLFNFGRTGTLKYDIVLDVMEYLRRETHYLPWSAAFNGFSLLATRLGPKNSKLFGKHILRLTKKVYEKLGFEERQNEKRLDTLNRAKVLSWVCRYGHKDCVTKSNELFGNLRDNNTPIPRNIRQQVYCSAIRDGNWEDFYYLWEKYTTENVATEEVMILNVIGCAKEPKIVEKYLKFILSKDVRPQDKSAALSALHAENLENVDVVFQYVTKNYKNVATAFGGMGDVASILSSLSSKFWEDRQIQELQAFFDAHQTEFKDHVNTFETAIKKAKENVKWSTEVLPHFLDILKTKNGSGKIFQTINIFAGLLLASIVIISNRVFV